MRGVAYAVGEIVVFMVAATLVGYLIGRIRSRTASLPSTWRDVLSDPLDLEVEELRRERAAALDTMAALAENWSRLRQAVLEAEHESAPADEIARLEEKVADQESLIARLERSVDAAEAEREKNTVIVPALAAGSPVDYSSLSSGSGRYADAQLVP